MGDAKIPNDWHGEYCCYAVMWPNSPQWLGVLRGVLSIAQEGRFWNEQTGNVIAAQTIVERTFDYNFENREVIMACGDTGIADALEAIATAIAGSGAGNATAIANCGGSGGGGLSISNPQMGIQTFISLTDGTQFPVFGSAPIEVLPPSGYPDGYDSLESYDVDKCRKATKMTDDFIKSLNNMAYVNWGAGVMGAGVIIACLVGLITVPYAAIPLLLFALCGNIGITAAVSALADYVESHRGEFVCILYEGDSVQTIITQIAEFIDMAIAMIDPAAAIGVVLKNIALWLMNGDTLNYLFSSAAALSFPDADCSTCGCFLEVATGTLISQEGNVYTVQSELVHSVIDYQVVNVYWRASEGVNCAANGVFKYLGNSGWSPSSNPDNDDWFIQSTGGVEYSSDTPPPTDTFYNMVRFCPVGNPSSVFTVEFRVEPA